MALRYLVGPSKVHIFSTLSSGLTPVIIMLHFVPSCSSPPVVRMLPNCIRGGGRAYMAIIMKSVVA